MARTQTALATGDAAFLDGQLEQDGAGQEFHGT
jgi:hypothetical protein